MKARKRRRAERRVVRICPHMLVLCVRGCVNECVLDDMPGEFLPARDHTYEDAKRYRVRRARAWDRYLLTRDTMPDDNERHAWVVAYDKAYDKVNESS